MQIESQREVLFYDDRLTAVRAEDGHIYVSVAEMCDALGLLAHGQRRRINKHDVLAEGLVRLSVDTPGGRQQVYMLRSNLVPLWLAGVQVSATRDEVREKLKRYQTEAAAVLWEAFQSGRLTFDTGDALAGVSPETRQAVEIARAVLALAENQELLEARLSGRMDGFEARLEMVEATLGDTGRNVTPDQAAQLSQAVKAVALAVGKKSGRNEFGGVYGEFYRRFGITSYKLLPARRFDDAMAWLGEWYQSVTSQGELPF